MKLLDFIEKWPITLMPFLVLLAIPFTVYSQPQTTSTAAAPEYSAALRLSPTSGVLVPGELVELSILLSTNGAKVDGVDAVLRYNPRMLKVSRVEKGTLFEEYVQESVDEAEGRIKLSGLTFDPLPKSGTLGTILFEILKEGTTTVFFEFTPGSTTDSNVALSGAGGVDILKEVKNGKYTVE